jgi:hypothetical protein
MISAMTMASGRLKAITSEARQLPKNSNGAVDQIAAVIKHVDRHAPGQGRLQFGEACPNVADELARIGAAEAEHQPFDGLAAAVGGDGAVAGQRADLDARHVADADRDAVAGVDNDGPDVVDSADAALDPHQRAILALVDAARAVIAAVGLDGAAKQIVGNAARGQRIVARHDLEGAHVAAEGVDVGDAGNGAERGTYHPVQQGPSLRQRQLGTVDGEHEHLAQRARDRSKPPGDTFGKIPRDIGQSFRDLITGPVDVGAVLEIDGDIGQRILGGRAQDLLVGQAEQLELDRDRDALLDLLRGEPRGLHDDLHLNRRDVRKGVDRQAGQHHGAGADQQQHAQDHEQALRKREGDQAREHFTALGRRECREAPRCRRSLLHPCR